MNQQVQPFHLLTVGWYPSLIERLWAGVAATGSIRASHLVHPSVSRHDWPDAGVQAGIHFFRQELRQRMPTPDAKLLASLEQDGVPSIHNMIMGDRVVSKQSYDDASAYATFLARRLVAVIEALKPSAVIGGFDGLHGGLGFAVARSLGIPWFALNFSVMPPGLACFCDRLSPAATVQVATDFDAGRIHALARRSLEEFEARAIQAPVYVERPPLSLADNLKKLPARIAAAGRAMREGQRKEQLRFTDAPGSYSVAAAARSVRRADSARKAIARIEALETPPAVPFVLFGLHMQPESSIDVWAPFFSNQMWVIELLARSIPPSHRLLVKVHKSDTSSYQAEQLDRMRSFPGVELVKPFVDTRSFIEKADLIITIQGTMGLEAALLGKPVIMLGESPVALFPSAEQVGCISDLPALVRRKLNEGPRCREEIVAAYALYLAPFMPASHNDWTVPGDEGEGVRFARLFEELRRHLNGRVSAAHQPDRPGLPA